MLASRSGSRLIPTEKQTIAFHQEHKDCGIKVYLFGLKWKKEKKKAENVALMSINDGKASCLHGRRYQPGSLTLLSQPVFSQRMNSMMKNSSCARNEDALQKQTKFTAFVSHAPEDPKFLNLIHDVEKRRADYRSDTQALLVQHSWWISATVLSNRNTADWTEFQQKRKKEKKNAEITSS